MTKPLSVLIVEDRESDAELIIRLLKKADYEVSCAQVDSAAQLRAALEKQGWDIVISDYKMPQFDGFAALKVLQEMELDTPFILVSGTISQETAIAIMSSGAQDYLDKRDMARLIPVVKREIKQAAVRLERKQAEAALRASEKQYRELIDLLPSGVVVHNQGVISLANHASAKFFGADNSRQLVGTKLMDRVHPDYRDHVLKRVQDALQDQNAAPLVEEKLLRFDGSCFDAEVAATPMTYAGKPSMLAIFNDVTKRKQAEEALRKRLAELEAVHTISKTLRTAQSVEETLPLLLDQTLAALDADTGAIWMYHPAQERLCVEVVRGWFAQFTKTTLKAGQGIAGKVYESGETHLSKDFLTDPAAYIPSNLTIPSGWGGVCVPIMSDKQAIGVLSISVPLPREITPDETKLLAALAEMTGAALYRLKLHEETAKSLKNLQALHEIDQAIAASFDLTMIFDIILTHVLDQLDVDACAVLLFQAYQNRFEYAAKRGFRSKVKQNSIPLNASPAGKAIQERRTVQIPDIRASAEKKEADALWAGEGFNAYIGVPLIIKGEVKGVLEVFMRQASDPAPEWLEFLNMLAGQAAIAVADIQLFDNLQRANQELSIAYDATIEGWSHALDLRDKETQGHTARVTELALQLARKMKIPEKDLLHFRRGAILHDIGKMGVPDHILLKPGPLTPDERKIIEQHAQIAYDMLHPIKYLQYALDIPYCHHEKWDGTGYPRGLSGEQIPLAARIFAIVDVWDALTTNRPYREAWSEAQTRQYIHAESGKHFDPQVVENFMALLDARD